MTLAPGSGPRERLLAESERIGAGELASRCALLLGGGEADDEFLRLLGGRAASEVLSGREGGRSGYWPRVWAARGLLHVFSEESVPALLQATGDDSWRVREMAAKALGAHRVGAGLAVLGELSADPVARVRIAAKKAAEAIIAASA